MARRAERAGRRLTPDLRPWLLILALAGGEAAAQQVIPGDVVPQALVPEQIDPAEWLGIPSGGLWIRPVRDLVLEELVLTLSPDRVKASYRWTNSAERDRTLEFSFPFPNIVSAPAEGPPLSGVFTDASLVVDGHYQPLAAVRLRVFMNDRDVTSVLEAAGVEVQALISGQPAEQPRDRRRAMEQALIDAGIPVDPIGWSFAIEPVWRITAPPHATLVATLTYRPYPGRSLDVLPGDEALDNLAHLSAYCADEQPGLLDWVQEQARRRSAAAALALMLRGQPLDQALDGAVADIELRDLSFLWRNNGWPQVIPKVSLLVDPEGGRAAFCLPEEVILGEDGVYRTTLTAVPTDGSLDIMFLH